MSVRIAIDWWTLARLTAAGAPRVFHSMPAPGAEQPASRAAGLAMAVKLSEAADLLSRSSATAPRMIHPRRFQRRRP